MNGEAWGDAAEALLTADVLLITAGAGLGVDAGLGTFRGSAAAGWPGLAYWGLEFPEMSCPDRFRDGDRFGGPRTAWAFWKWRADAYSQAPLHEGYGILNRWAQTKGAESSFVFTSNIDGHFRRLDGVRERLVECHGTVNFLQCQKADERGACPQGDRVWPTPFDEIAALEVDPRRFQVVGPLPLCPGCGQPARPAVVMFGDLNCSHAQIGAQSRRLDTFFEGLRRRSWAPTVTILELGAGVAISTVRRRSVAWADEWGATLIRVNPEDPEVELGLGARGISLKTGALEALKELDTRMAGMTASR